MFISNEDEQTEDQQEKDLEDEMEYITSLHESMMIRAMTGSSSQKLTTVDFGILFIIKC